jgi:hypothetical protein
MAYVQIEHMPYLVKNKIEDLIYNYDTRPKRIHIKLEKLKLKKKIEIELFNLNLFLSLSFSKTLSILVKV